MHLFNKLRTQLNEKPYIIAIFITVFIILWMMSGGSNANEQSTSESQQRIAKVKVETLHAKPINRSLQLYGRTEPNKVARVAARQEGEVIEILVKEGQFVEQGTVILKLDKSDLDSQITAAKALLEQSEVEYQGALKLKQKGLNDQSALARAKASLEQAKASLANLELSLKRTEIKAPFSGVINQRLVELGDYLGRGDPILELADLNPLVVRADVTQKEVMGLSVGQSVSGLFINNKTYSGKIRYIASVADEGTNTFKIEAAFDNPNMQYRAGFSTQLDITYDEVNAIHLSPAFMALDEDGNIGVKTVDNNNRVVFSPIDVVKSEASGVWMAGLGESANVITLGQGFVRIGDTVEPVFANEQE
ncbi:MAG: efflux RND transporter periplasmic adaptor subunit [Pseudoalteromonas spongiae]|uniref:efflux RND transporter periplasmic adaptor subunit n=1 Tax=Pseudoalteromonas TaxID=53246 RepID=UPI000CF6DECD|nr:MULTISPECIES: efflux RND transporter periplasmic adaptor subunit [Pseudoalteromonas]TMO85306.1 efflux RND transporter periplasmic adaptor subunit [Pseudoalteromonas spongiae]